MKSIDFDCVLFLYRQRLFENLRMIPHAPGVQMQRKLKILF